MAGYLIAEEGPLTGIILRFEEGQEWVIGRDPDVTDLVLEDPLVSRRHVIIHLTSEGYLLENLSSVNPATQNGKIITESVLLSEGDIIQVGSTFFRFTSKEPALEEEAPVEEAPTLEEEDLTSAEIESTYDARWLMKVITGPNAGAEFSMNKGAIYLIGKDPNLCDIIFHDLSVSRQHARLTVDDQENVFIEDMGSRNGVLINGEPISGKHQISSQDLVALGTTTFLLIDRKEARETIVSATITHPARAEETHGEEEMERETATTTLAPVREWKEMRIKKRHLVLGGIGIFLLFFLFMGTFSLFKVEPVVVAEKHESEQIQEALKNYPDVQFSFTQSNGKLFLVGHVLTAVDKQELLYTLSGISFIGEVEDNVVVDEYVWQNMNALLMSNPDWQGISIHSPSPGKFVMRGYLETLEQAQALSDYMNVNFPYLDRLDNQIVVEGNLATQIQSMLMEKGFGTVLFQLSNGELVLTGRVDEKNKTAYEELVNHFKALMGVRTVKNFVVLSTSESSRIDISDKYKVTGSSKKDAQNLFVLINGRIVGKGDLIDGMMITTVLPSMILLEKDGLKFRINYNLQ
ncbi:MAG: type III secretion system inner membrane ring subunit SctD [Chlamydiales bacterium]|nr:type III secretion system inner membrane ring subunit SctD [Chlamydiales bacterium]